MGKISGGLLMYRVREDLEVLLVHLGGPFWARKDAGAWFVPKGEIEPGEEPLAAARREFEEETGLRPEEPFQELGSVTQKSGKTVHAWAFRGDCDPASLVSQTFTMEWPPRSGKTARFPEVDRARYFTLVDASVRMHAAELELFEWLERLWKDGGLSKPPGPADR